MASKPEIKMGPKSGKIQRVPTPKPGRDEYSVPERKIPRSNMPQPRPRRRGDNDA